jgi:general secretion pathway protein J
MTHMRRARRAGITLIEVMVAMAILAIVSTLLYTGFVQTANNKKRIEGDLARNHEVRMALERIVRELSMAFVSAQTNALVLSPVSKTAFIGKDDGDGSRIDFTSFSHQRLYRDAHESDQNELSYFVTDDPDDSSKDVLVRREQNRIDDDPQKGGTAQVMVRDVESFELSYLDPMTGEWLSTWDTTQAAGQPNRLPTQVKITLTVPNLRGTGPAMKVTTRASLPLTYALNHATYRGQ